VRGAGKDIVVVLMVGRRCVGRVRRRHARPDISRTGLRHLLERLGQALIGLADNRQRLFGILHQRWFRLHFRLHFLPGRRVRRSDGFRPTAAC
jgi:hypothetical protein